VLRELGFYYLRFSNHERVYPYEQPKRADPYDLSQQAILAEGDVSLPLVSSYIQFIWAPHARVMASGFTFLNVLYFLLQATFLPVLMLFLFLALLRNRGILKPGAPSNNILSLLESYCITLLLIHTGLVVTVACAFTFGIDRYVETIFPIALLLQCFCIFYLWIGFSYLGKNRADK
jgi:hypothetical protein